MLALELRKNHKRIMSSVLSYLKKNEDSFSWPSLNLRQYVWVPVCFDYGLTLNCTVAIKLNHTATWMENSIKFSLVHWNRRNNIDFVFAILKYFQIRMMMY